MTTNHAQSHIVSLLSVLIAALLLWSVTEAALAVPPADPYADQVDEDDTGLAVVNPQQAEGAPDGNLAIVVNIPGNDLVLDMGAGEEGSGDLTIYYEIETIAISPTVQFLDVNKTPIETHTVSLLLVEPGVFTQTVPFDSPATPYRYVRFVPSVGAYGIDAVMAATFRPDEDGDGVSTAEEDINQDGNPTNDDSDGDGTPDYLDSDDDDDTVPTINEDANGDGNPTNDDTDSDGIPDYLDGDDDGDGVPTASEDANSDGDPTNDDSDGDGLPNYRDGDDDNDGIPTAGEDLNENGDATDDDTDGDGIPNYRDADDDGDGTPTISEDADENGNPSNDDSDGDGTPDYLDPDPISQNLGAYLPLIRKP